MIRLRLTVLAALVAAAFAGGLTYFVTPLAGVDAQRRLPATVLTIIEHRPLRKSEPAIPKQLPDAQASAGIDEPPISRHLPLPKTRPTPR